MEKNKNTLFKNTIMLYILRFSTYFFSFISVPYQTRIMGSLIYGKVGVAMALMIYFQLFLDYGFILSATEEVANNRNDKSILNAILTSVTGIKIAFSIFSIIFLSILCSVIPQYRPDFMLYFWFLMATIANCFLPDFLYRGLEDMTPITIRTLVTKALFTCLIFVFLKTPSDILWVPILTFFGNLTGLIWSMYDIKKRYSIKFIKIGKKEIIDSLKKSSSFFLSRIVSTLYSATNTIILGFIDSVGITVGLYTAAYKLISTGQGALTPISDSIYPYMIKNKDFKLIKKILIICMPVILIGAIIIWIYADELCILIFGSDFGEAGKILRAMLPLAVVTLPDYILGFPSLSALGLAKQANYSIYFTTAIHFILLFILVITNSLSAYTLALLISIAGVVETTYRALVIWLNRGRINEA